MFIDEDFMTDCSSVYCSAVRMEYFLFRIEQFFELRSDH